MKMHNPQKTGFLLIGLLIICFSACAPKIQEPSDEVIYFGGDIITMQGDSPAYAEAVVINDGKIVWVGNLNEANDKYANAQKRNLNGKTMLPGFVDAHGHGWLTGFQSLSANLLPPPDGGVNTIPGLVEKVKEWGENNQAAIDKLGVMIGWGYDDAQMEEGRHPTADELDQISAEIPVLVVHQSGHLGAMNHKALELSGYNAGTPDPAGGLIRRVEGSQEPNGVLEEMAMFIPALKIFGKIDESANEKIALAGLESYARFGYTTVQEGRATKEQTETWKKLADEGKLMLDVAAYPDIQAHPEFVQEIGVQKEYKKPFSCGWGKNQP